ncbi:MAG: HupE/UreJ family protein, partial [Hyphomonadaceae bacterium]|nr:HupE/UreJ family protein [Hyphomonadaceae bacterium]
EAVDVTRLYALGGDETMDRVFAEEVAGAFQVSAADQSCSAAGEPSARIIPAGKLVASWRFQCPPGAIARGPIAIESHLFLDVAPSHLHFVALSGADGASAEAVLTGPSPRASMTLSDAPAVQPFGATVLHFIPVGAEHVWTGLDHVAFILALVLLTAGGLRALLFAATGFTLGHTATLGLAAVGVLRPDTAAIEALIGFTIAFVALEASGGARMRLASGPAAITLALAGVASLFLPLPMSPLVWFGLAAFVYAYPRGFPQGAAWLALIFGLVHGCGFAGALADLDLPKPRLLASLLGFNLGVEAGQLVVIAGALGVGWLARRAPPQFTRDLAPAAGAGLFALGLYWFVSRLI